MTKNNKKTEMHLLNKCLLNIIRRNIVCFEAEISLMKPQSHQVQLRVPCFVILRGKAS